LGDFLVNEAANAVHDVRQKLFEEAWYGRVVTAAPVMEVMREQDVDRSRSATFEDNWGRGQREESELPLERDDDEPEVER